MMMNQYPQNRDASIKLMEHIHRQLLTQLKETSVGLIRLAADEATKNQAIQSISYYEKLWEDVFNFYSIWKNKIIVTSEMFMTDNDRLNSELEIIEQDFTTEGQKLKADLTIITKKR